MPRVCSPPHGVQQPDDCLKAQEVSGDSGGERVDRTLLCTRPYAEVRSLFEMTFNAFTTKRVSGWGKMTERTTSWPEICAVRNAAPFGSSEYANFTSWSLGLTFVHSSCMTLPFGLTDVQFFEERAGHPEFFLNRSLEFFRHLASPLEAQEQEQDH